MLDLPKYFKVWLAMLVVSAALAWFSYRFVDMPMIELLWPPPYSITRYMGIVGGFYIVLLEIAVVALIVLQVIAKRSPVPFWKSVALACAVSFVSYEVNSRILKVCFGLPSPMNVMLGTARSFHWFAGSGGSSFPSGHMVLASAFAGVLMRLHPATRVPLAWFLGLIATLLVLGSIHFLSDLIAGAFFGLSVGLGVGQLVAARQNEAAMPGAAA